MIQGKKKSTPKKISRTTAATQCSPNLLLHTRPPQTPSALYSKERIDTSILPKNEYQLDLTRLNNRHDVRFVY